jgi:uncharacterized protein (DUF1330 family)
MSAYILILRETPVQFPEELVEYRRKGRAIPAAAKLTPLVAYGPMIELEGKAPDGVVILKFDSVEDAQAWYNSPAYQDALPHRLRAADYRAVIVQGM